ncbi:MAG: 3D domain-containing protein [Verrucomicrobiota bacterium]|nr:3D domain-containing protein [Verrucomicrobiota bacterium]
MKKLLIILPILTLATGCATQQTNCKKSASDHCGKRVVRTTAYTHTEPGGRKNAIGTRLSCGQVKSAASDWSRFPLGTKFKILTTGEIRRIDDYGSALVGTNTIDLYKTTRGDMRTWGVRHVDIEILEWGSAEESLRILTPRARNSHVRSMIADLRRQT